MDETLFHRDSYNDFRQYCAVLVNDAFDPGAHSKVDRSAAGGETSYKIARKNDCSFISTLFSKHSEKKSRITIFFKSGDADASGEGERGYNSVRKVEYFMPMFPTSSARVGGVTDGDPNLMSNINEQVWQRDG